MPEGWQKHTMEEEKPIRRGSAFLPGGLYEHNDYMHAGAQ